MIEPFCTTGVVLWQEILAIIMVRNSVSLIATMTVLERGEMVVKCAGFNSIKIT